MTEGFSRIDQELCTGCANCAATCPAEAITGEKNKPHSLSEERCIGCGRCVQICSAYDSIFQECPTPRRSRLAQRGLPSGVSEPLFAAYDRSFIAGVTAALADPDRVVIAHCGPAIHGALAEDFGLPAGAVSSGRIVAALRKAGFSKVYGLGLPAALAVVELAHELVQRLQTGRILPVVNSSCPAAVKFIEQFHPQLIYHIAGCKSPSQIAGTLLKTCVAGTMNLDPARVFNVSVGPCTSRKFEVTRPEMRSGGYPDVDAVLTTRELAYLIKSFGIDLSAIDEEAYDDELPGIAGMENVYSTPGGITEAVLQAAGGLLAPGAGQPLGVKFEETGTEGVRIASAQSGRFNVKGVALSGLPNAIPYLDAIKAGKSEIAFLEMLACPMGCVSGGGQPKVLLPQDKAGAYADRARLNGKPEPLKMQRIAQHEDVKRIYRDWFGKPCGDKSNRILQTQYAERKLSQ